MAALHEEEDDGKGFCHGLRNQAGILANGTVIPCCLDGEGIINLGNINNDLFSNIIEGERATNIVDGFSEELQLKSYVENVDTVKDLESKHEISPHKARAYFLSPICRAVRFLPQNSAEAKS